MVVFTVAAVVVEMMNLVVCLVLGFRCVCVFVCVFRCVCVGGFSSVLC